MKLNLARGVGEVGARSVAGEGDRVGTQQEIAVYRPDHPHPRRLRASTSPARSAGEV